jgi:hypothetical protein
VRTRPTYTARLVVGLGLAFALAACGQGTYSINNSCPKLESVGGNPSGTWTVTNYCQIHYTRSTSDDWCSKLVYDQSGVRDGLFLGIEPTQILAGSWVRFTPHDPDMDPFCKGAAPNTCGDYESALAFGGTTTTIFPLGCMRQHQVDPTCEDLQKKARELIGNNVLPTVYQNLPKNPGDPDDPKNFTCVPATGIDGCACTYNITTANVATDLGAWRVDGNQLETFPGTLAQAGVIDYFLDNGNNSLSMHGHDGMPLLAKDPLRNLDLVRCTDDLVRSKACPCDADAKMRGICTGP